MNVVQHRMRSSPPPSRGEGFTLVEVLISIALIAIALFGVMGAITYGTRHARSGEELSEATQLGRQLLVYLQETSSLDTVELGEAWLTEDSGLNDDQGITRALNAAPLGGATFSQEQLQRYQRRIVCSRVSDDATSHRFGLARATVEIFWESKQGRRRVELCGTVTHARP